MGCQSVAFWKKTEQSTLCPKVYFLKPGFYDPANFDKPLVCFDLYTHNFQSVTCFFQCLLIDDANMNAFFELLIYEALRHVTKMIYSDFRLRNFFEDSLQTWFLVVMLLIFSPQTT